MRSISPCSVAPWISGGAAAITSQLAVGRSLAVVRTEVATGGEAQGDINAIYKSVLGRTVDPSGLAAIQGELANGASLASVRIQVASSGEAAADLTSMLTPLAPSPPTPALIATEQAQLGAGLSLSDIVGRPGEMGQYLRLTDNPTFIAPQPNETRGTDAAPTVFAATPFSGPGIGIDGFNPATDLLELPASSIPNLTALALDEAGMNGNVNISDVGTGQFFTLFNVNEQQLTPANFAFV